MKEDKPDDNHDVEEPAAPRVVAVGNGEAADDEEVEDGNGEKEDEEVAEMVVGKEYVDVPEYVGANVAKDIEGNEDEDDDEAMDDAFDIIPPLCCCRVPDGPLLAAFCCAPVFVPFA